MARENVKDAGPEALGATIFGAYAMGTTWEPMGNVFLISVVCGDAIQSRGISCEHVFWHICFMRIFRASSHGSQVLSPKLLEVDPCNLNR